MNDFKAVILGICIASVCLGAMYMLKPKGNMEKSVRFGFAVIFLTLTISLFVSLFKGGGKAVPTYALSPDYSVSEKITEISARQIVAEVLRENGLKFEEIKIFTNIEESGGISIKRITVKTSENAEKVIGSINAVIKSDGVEVINE